MPPSIQSPPRWTFAVATVIWAMFVGLVVRVTIVAVAPLFGGQATMQWLARSPLGLATGAVVIQVALLAMAQLRSTLMPELRADLISGLLTRPSRWMTATALVLGLAPLANLCGILVAKLTGADLGAVEFVGALVRRASWIEFSVMGVALMLLPAVVEESIFRGLLLGSLDRLRPAVAITISALAFGAFHLDIAQGVATSILGLGFGYIVHTTRSLLGSMVAHGTYNLMVLVTQRFAPTTASPPTFQIIELGAGLLIAAAAAQRLWRLRCPSAPPVGGRVT